LNGRIRPEGQVLVVKEDERGAGTACTKQRVIAGLASASGPLRVDGKQMRGEKGARRSALLFNGGRIHARIYRPWRAANP